MEVANRDRGARDDQVDSCLTWRGSLLLWRKLQYLLKGGPIGGAECLREIQPLVVNATANVQVSKTPARKTRLV